MSLEDKYFFIKTNYSEYWIKKIKNKKLEYYEKRAIKLLNLSNNNIILEIGCGDGRFTKQIIKKNKNIYVGIDISYKMIKYTRNNIKRSNFIISDAEYLPFRNEVFDRILIFATLFFISNQKKTILEIKRVSKKNCKIVIDHRNILNVKILINKILFKILKKIKNIIKKIIKIKLIEKILKKIIGEEKYKTWEEYIVKYKLIHPQYPCFCPFFIKFCQKIGLNLKFIEYYSKNKNLLRLFKPCILFLFIKN